MHNDYNVHVLKAATGKVRVRAHCWVSIVGIVPVMELISFTFGTMVHAIPRVNCAHYVNKDDNIDLGI